MNVNLRYFASVREALGTGAARVQTQAATAGALRDELIASSQLHAEALARSKALRMALDQTLCEEDAALSDGCELAFFPPVTGG